MAVKRVLGIDPGVIVCGWGIVEGEKDAHLVAHGRIIIPRKTTMEEKRKRLICDIKWIFEKYEPTHAAIEDQFVGINPRSALILSAAKGVIFGAIVANAPSISVAEYAPATVKKAVTGRGQSEKQFVAKCLQAQVGTIPFSPTISTDETDAIAVAVCHFYRLKARGKNEQH